MNPINLYTSRNSRCHLILFRLRAHTHLDSINMPAKSATLIALFKIAKVISLVNHTNYAFKKRE